MAFQWLSEIGSANHGRTPGKIYLFTSDEFCKVPGILIAAAGYNSKGVELK